MSNPANLALIYGSTRPGRFCDKVAGWAVSQICSAGEFTLTVIDPASGSAHVQSEAGVVSNLTRLRRQLELADAFIVVTPEYNHGYTAVLKSLIDSVGAEWQAKPVGFVSYGGISGGIRAVEQLRQVFAELHVVTIRDAVSFATAWEQFDSNGTLKNPERAERQMRTMLKRIKWWAETLRNGRNAIPYELAA